MFPESEPSSDDSLFQIESPIGPIDYVAGRGLRLGRTGLHVGGFTTLEIDKLDGESGELALDSLNFLISWDPVPFFHAFADIELDDLLSYEMRTGETFSNPKVNFERLYADLSRDDALNLRIGKFQTPVGLWNLVPAEPFTWTANEPVLVETAFDEHQTGGAVFGSSYPASNTLRYWVYGQFMGPLDPSEDPPPADHSAGGRLQYADAFDQWGIGSSFLASERSGSWNYLGGLDAFWQIGPLELQAEWAISRGDVRGLKLWGVYVQGVYHLGHHVDLLRSLHVVGRYEHFDPMEGQGAGASNLGNVGLAWLPVRFLVLKAGYQFADQQTEFVDRGLFSSMSILF
jgi:hypothetical protein